MAMFGKGLSRLPNGLMAGQAFPQGGDMSGEAGSLTPMQNGMLAGPDFPSAGTPAGTALAGNLSSAPSLMPQAPAATAHFGPSTWQTIAGLVGDGLLTATGHNAMFAPIAAQARQNQAMMQRQAQQQAQEYQRQMLLKQWERDNPAPTTIGQNAAYLDSQSPGLGRQYLTNYANNGGSQGPASITVNGQQMVRAPNAAGAGGVAQPTPTAEGIARLKANPHEAALFDQQFGPGASAQYLGNGGAAPASGPVGFPLYPVRH